MLAPLRPALTPAWRLWVAFAAGLAYTLVLLVATGEYHLNILLGNLAHMSIHMTGLVLALMIEHTAHHLAHGRRQQPRLAAQIKAYGALLNVAVLVVIAATAVWQLWAGHAHEAVVGEAPAAGAEPAHLGAHHEAHHPVAHGHHFGEGEAVFITAAFGLLMHLISFFVLRGGRHQCVNVRGAYVHIRFDVALTGLTALVGVLMATTHLPHLDEALAPLMVLLVIYSLYEVARHAWVSLGHQPHGPHNGHGHGHAPRPTPKRRATVKAKGDR